MWRPKASRPKRGFARARVSWQMCPCPHPASQLFFLLRSAPKSEHCWRRVLSAKLVQERRRSSDHAVLAAPALRCFGSVAAEIFITIRPASVRARPRDAAFHEHVHFRLHAPTDSISALGQCLTQLAERFAICAKTSGVKAVVPDLVVARCQGARCCLHCVLERVVACNGGRGVASGVRRAWARGRAGRAEGGRAGNEDE